MTAARYLVATLTIRARVLTACDRIHAGLANQTSTAREPAARHLVAALPVRARVIRTLDRRDIVLVEQTSAARIRTSVNKL